MAMDNFYEHLPQDGTPDSLVILLHGLGSNGRDLISLAPLFAKSLPHAAFVSPDAPFAYDMVPAGYPDSYQWFSLQNRDPQVMLRGVKRVLPLLEAFVEAQRARFALAYEQLALVGFSQGTMTSLHIAPRLKGKIAGVVGYSGALLADPEAQISALQKPPIHLIHGQADDVVPVSAREMAAVMLEAQGFKVSGHTTAGLTHSIDMHGIQDGAAFLKSAFAV
jgi:phospholipase/carboxylesterase